jgi:elongation factor 1-gamma
VTCFWIFRGKGLPEIVREVDDTELFYWTEIPDIQAEKAKITDYLAWDGETFAKNPVLEGRAFK